MREKTSGAGEHHQNPAPLGHNKQVTLTRDEQKGNTMQHIEWLDGRTAQLELVPHGTVLGEDVVDAALAVTMTGDSVVVVEGSHEELRAFFTRGLALVLRDASDVLQVAAESGVIPLGDDGEFVDVAALVSEARKARRESGFVVRWDPDHPSVTSLTDTEHRCPKCGAPVRYVADYGAPGIGQHWACANGHDWTRIGATFHDVADGPFERNPEDER
jgi:hypothetical protein